MAARKRRTLRPGSKEDISQLRALAKAKLSGTQAAKQRRRTRGAVAQKAMALRIRFRSIPRAARRALTRSLASGCVPPT